MTEQPAGLVDIQVGTLHLRAPDTEPQIITGTHGQVAQWTGDGRTLVSFSVATRVDSHLTSPFSLANHVRWELDRLQQRMDGEVQRVEATNREIPGATGAAVGEIGGVRMTLATHNEVLATSDGQDQYVVHAMVTDTPEGRACAAELLRDVRF